MEIGLMVVLYFLVIVIAILALILVHDKQVLQKIISEHLVQQDKLSELRVENRRLEHTIKMQDESIVHLINGQEEEPLTPAEEIIKSVLKE